MISAVAEMYEIHPLLRPMSVRDDYSCLYTECNKNGVSYPHGQNQH
jgi:hypothetical protein